MSGFSRGEEKIAGAARALGVDFRGKVVLDIGSSTGGFTGFSLRAGAKRVIAVEKGSRQMRAPLRFDERVELREKTDILDFRTDEKIDIILMDVSFLSVKEVLSYAKKEFVGKDTELLVMLKPQFEARPEQLVRGVVKNEKMRREIIRGFEEWLREKGFLILGKRDNEVLGRHGNRERFYRLKLSH